MPGQQTCAPPAVTLPAQLDAAAAEQAAGQITTAFTPRVSVVIADLTAAACCDRSAIRNLLKAHRKATARAVSAGESLVEVDPVFRDTEASEDLALSGEVLQDG